MKKHIDEGMYAFTVDYLPILKNKFTNLLGSTNEMEQLFLDSAFKSYESYLIFAQNEDLVDENFEAKILDLRVDLDKKSSVIMLYYQPMLTEINKSNLIEIDKKLLKDILSGFKELIHLIKKEQAMKK